jgi:hypothetical protein
MLKTTIELSRAEGPHPAGDFAESGLKPGYIATKTSCFFVFFILF